ncbi:MAG: amidohydrolase family protein [archaeon]|nr:amidohydrolase family protein [archaeon]
MKTIANGLILKGLDLTPVKENICIEDGKIIEISKDVLEGEIIDVDGAIVCPSFINAHTHIGDSIIKDEGDGLSLGQIVKPPNGIKHLALESAEDDEIIKVMQDSMWDMYNSGTSHFIDYREGGVKGIKLLKEASKDIPINPIIFGRDGSFYGEDPDLHQVKVAIRKLLKYADGIAPSGFGEIEAEVAELICEECKKAGKISSIHVAENEGVQIESLAKTNKTEVERAIDAGFNQIVHMTNPKNDDINKLANSNTSLTICPRSNGALSVGIVPLFDILSLGIKPLIGSDNIMFNSPNMFRELEFTLKEMKAYSKNYINPKDILKLATTNACTDNFVSDNDSLNNDSLNNSSNNHSLINNLGLINKSFIGVGQNAEFFVCKNKSNNPYLSLINRTELNDLLYLSY